jgi:2-phosphosulfolactate phosphatase
VTGAGGTRSPEDADAGRRQQGSDLRCEWGIEGLRRVASGARAVVVVDVLRFTTAVSVGVGRGGEVLPYMWDMGDAARAYAAEHGAELAGGREDGGWSLSPADLARLPTGTRLVLPSPNGSALAFAVRSGLLDEGDEADPDDAAAADPPAVLAGCLRNAGAVAAVAAATGGPIAVIPAGERWGGTLGPLRPALEDLLGAGAVLAALLDRCGYDPASASVEARAAVTLFRAASDDLAGWLAKTGSGQELTAWGFDDDVAAAAVLDAEAVAPVLDDRTFRAVTPPEGRVLR